MSMMLSVVFLLAAGQPPTDTASIQPVAEQPATTAPAPEPKMVCKYEHATGSRLTKTKVCRPEGEKGDEQSTQLQRQLDKFADRVPQGGLGN